MEFKANLSADELDYVQIDSQRIEGAVAPEIGIALEEFALRRGELAGLGHPMAEGSQQPSGKAAPGDAMPSESGQPTTPQQ